MLRTAILGVLAGLSLCAVAGAQEILQICSETFDYPAGSGLHDQSGGVGWANNWWSNGDATNSAAVTQVPGLDAVGGMAVDVLENTGSYRFPSTTGFEHMVDANLTFGEDGTTVWITFLSRRIPGGDDLYGGFSLNWQFVNEEIFIGVPSAQYQWGIHDDPNNTPNPITIFGSDPDTLSRVWVRIDFQPGAERLQFWLDPASEFPATPADIDTAIHDMRFNEVALKSGNGLVHGYYWDDIRMYTYAEGAGTAYCFGDGSGSPCPCGNDDVANPGTGGCQNGSGVGAVLSGTGSDSVATDNFKLWGRNLLPNQPALFFQGDNATGGGSGSAFGDGLRCAGQNVIRIQIRTPDANGNVHTTLGIGAKGMVVGGDTKYYQLWYRNPGTSPCGTNFNLTNGLEFTWAP